MNHLTHQKLRTDCTEFEVLMTGCYSGSTGHGGEPCRPALLSFQREAQGKCVTALSLGSSCRLLECGDRNDVTNIQVVIQPRVRKWEEGTYTDPEAGKSPWISQKRHKSEISRQIGEPVAQTVFEKPVFFRSLPFHQNLHQKPIAQSSLRCSAEPAGEKCIWGKGVACSQSSKRDMESHYCLFLHSHCWDIFARA